MKRKGWTHAICIGCWKERNPGRDPVRMTTGQEESCCLCLATTKAGIYVRAAPGTVLCEGHEESP